MAGQKLVVTDVAVLTNAVFFTKINYVPRAHARTRPRRLPLQRAPHTKKILMLMESVETFAIWDALKYQILIFLRLVTSSSFIFGKTPLQHRTTVDAQRQKVATVKVSMPWVIS